MMALYEKILVTLDCSPVDEAILEHITALASVHGAKLTLLHVVHSHTLDQDRYLRDKAEEAMQAAKLRLEKAGISVDVLIKSGEPEEEVISAIQESNYDLLAMATHGHSHAMGLLLGSVSEQVKHKVAIPMLLVRAKEKP
jgi:nucleotide-binding universal stress UspA family protein